MRSLYSRSLLCMLLFVLPSVAVGGAAPINANATDFEHAVEERFAAGIDGDPSFSSYFLSDATYTVSGVMASVGQAALLSKKDPTEKEWVTISDFNVIVRGDVAIATYDSNDHERFRTFSLDTPLRHTDTFVLRDGRWLVAAIQADVEPLERVSIDPNAWEAYVGVYRAADGTTHTVRRNGASYTDTETGDSRPYVMIPTSSSTFRVADDPADYVFIKDAKGTVIALLNFQSHLPTMYYRQH
jgi:hypothetical protein